VLQASKVLVRLEGASLGDGSSWSVVADVVDVASPSRDSRSFSIRNFFSNLFMLDLESRLLISLYQSRRCRLPIQVADNRSSTYPDFLLCAYRKD